MSARGITVLVAQRLRMSRLTLIGWSVSLALLVVIYVAMFPSIEQIDLQALLAQFPEQLLRAFGFEGNVNQLSTAIGFLNTELFGFMLPLAIIFLPVGVIVRMTSRAEDNHHLDALLTTPLARWQLIAASAVAATVAMLIPIIAMTVTALAAAWIAGVALSLSQIGGSALSLLPLGAFAGAIAIVVVGSTRRHGTTTAIAAGVTVVMYLMNVLVGLIDFFDQIKGLSLFHYYSDWVNKGIEWPQYFAVLAISAALTVLGAVLFERRDLS